jgi:hypothetical protein
MRGRLRAGKADHVAWAVFLEDCLRLVVVAEGQSVHERKNRRSPSAEERNTNWASVRL